MMTLTKMMDSDSKSDSKSDLKVTVLMSTTTLAKMLNLTGMKCLSQLKAGKDTVKSIIKTYVLLMHKSLK